MINLIPKNAKRNLLIEYWTRTVSVWFSIWAIALFASACMLLPAYVLVSTQVSTYEASAAEASENVAKYQNVSTSLIHASQQARFIVNESSLPAFSEYISLFENLQGQNIQITQIQFQRTKDGISPIVLTGVAVDRQTLATFRDRLRADGRVASVDLPISNLAMDKDINFNITVTLNNEIDV